MRQIRRNEGMPYYTLAKTTILTKSLSLKAKALLTILLNLPEGWHFTVAGILSFLQEGREAVMSAIRELEVAGYLTKTQVRDTKGRILGPDYVVREVISVTPKSETPATEDPLPEVPEAAGAGQHKTKEKKTKKQWTNEDICSCFEKIHQETVDFKPKRVGTSVIVRNEAVKQALKMEGGVGE